jgi:hypothetical protein
MDVDNVAKLSASRKLIAEKNSNAREDFEDLKRETELKKSAKYVIGDLTNPEVARTFNLMSYSGPSTIIAMNDSDDDFLDSDDNEFESFSDLAYGDEVERIDDYLKKEKIEETKRYVAENYVDESGVLVIDNGFIKEMRTLGFVDSLYEFPDTVKRIELGRGAAEGALGRLKNIRKFPPISFKNIEEADHMFFHMKKL